MRSAKSGGATALDVLIVTPVARGSRQGNRITALRWAAILRSLGRRVRVRQSYSGEDARALVALHAGKSRDAVVRFREAHPGRPCFVALTGTDLYVDGRDDPDVGESLRRATGLLVLHPLAARSLPPELAAKVRVIRQSARAPAPEAMAAHAPVAPPSIAGGFDAAVVGHLRPVKAPFLAAEALRLLPADSRVRVLHAGRALSDELELRARDEMRASRRYVWLGPLRRGDALGLIARSRVLIVPSRAEGGANVVSEAIACGTPVLATRIEGSVGLLGDDHPGLFPVDDARALAALLERCERDGAFLEELRRRSIGRAPLHAPAAERAAWSALLAAP